MRRLSAVAVGIAVAGLGMTACTKDEAATEDVVASSPRVPGGPVIGESGEPDRGSGGAGSTVPGAAQADHPSSKDASPQVLGQAASTPTSDSCFVPAKLTQGLPYYIAGKNIVLTRIMKACTTTSGAAGYEKDTPFLAMGFPCTGGSGRVDIKGTHYASPKMVSFILATDCPMSPSAVDAVKTAVTEAAGLAPAMKLMAFMPFVVQYWEIPGMSDADIGFSIDLRSAPALEGAWKKLQAKDGLRVRFFGRENSWVQGGHFYMVDGDLRLTGRTQFQLEVQTVKALSPEEIAVVKERCETLKPARNCGDVF